MLKANTTNTFNEGMIKDLNPLVTPNTILTDCLNGTLITFSGNENALQNDMGNGRVETAYLPEGYIPLGTAELGGIIYIVSYNPLINKCLIGSFPSPERNISSDEITNKTINSITNNTFVSDDGIITNTLYRLELPDTKLNPGDKYKIYATNNGISNTYDTLSDIQIKSGTEFSPNNTNIGDNPMYVTIHVVSISDDGKITYLDDSLLWTEFNTLNNTTTLRYYIPEISDEDDTNIETDLYNHRTITSTGYNVFNSKISGRLALLFLLCVIDTYEVTWNAVVSDNDSTEKKAIININTNWTSSHKDINAKYLVLNVENIGDGMFKSMLLNSDFPFYNIGTETEPKYRYIAYNYKENAVDPKKLDGRENDGTDLDIEINNLVTYIYPTPTEGSNTEYNYQKIITIGPGMPFGYLQSLEQEIHLDLSKLGTGNLSIYQYKYYVEDDSLILNYAFDAYPESGKQFDRIAIVFIPLNSIESTDESGNKSLIIDSSKYTYDDLFSNTETKVESEKKPAPYTDFHKIIRVEENGISGFFLDVVNFKEDGIQRNSLYLLDIVIRYKNNTDNTSEYKHSYRWLYTTKQWNQEYINNTKDFKDLTLDNVIDIKSSLNYVDNIDDQISIYTSNMNIPLLLKEEDHALGALILTLNYNGDDYITPTVKSIDGEVKLSVDDRDMQLSELFSIKDYTLTSAITNILITTGEQVISERSSDSTDLIPSKFNEKYSNTCVSSNDLKKAIDNGITVDSTETTKVHNDNLIDSVKYIENNCNFSGNLVEFSLQGALFSRINADFNYNVTGTASQLIRPFILYLSDLERLNLYQNTSSWTETIIGLDNKEESIPHYKINNLDFNYIVAITWRDQGNGNPLEILARLSDRTHIQGNWDSPDWEKNPEIYLGAAEGDDDFSVDYWNQLGVYNSANGIKAWLDNVGSFIACIRYIGRGRSGQGSFLGYGYNISAELLTQDGVYNLWIKTESNEYYPFKAIELQSGSAARKKFAKLILDIFTQICYVLNETTNIDISQVININYLNNYSKQLNIGLTSEESSPDKLLEKYININNLTLNEILSKFKNDDELWIDLYEDLKNNISTSKLLESFNNVITHTFNINIDDIKLLYDNRKNTTFSSVGITTISDGYFITTSRNSNDWYLYDDYTNSFVTGKVPRGVKDTAIFEISSPTSTENNKNIIKLYNSDSTKPDDLDPYIGYTFNSNGLNLYRYMKIQDNLIVASDAAFEKFPAQIKLNTYDKHEGYIVINNNCSLSLTSELQN